MNTETELYDLIDLVDYTLSNKFKEKWRFKYGERLLNIFQVKLLYSFKKQKRIKKSGITKFFVSDSGFSPETVNSFYEDIDLELYSPIVNLHE
jgi:hypothetical protein